MTHDHEDSGLRGDELADEAVSATPPPDPDEAAKGGIRGDGLAKDASPEQQPDAPGPEEVVGGGLRGQQLADEA
jgi:hypothetical protein